MKKRILLALLLLFSFFANAQQKNYKLAISLMLQYAEKDFKDILGEKMGDEPSLESGIYAPKEALGIGSEKIYKSNNSDKAFYVCTVALLDANDVLQDVLNYVNAKVKAGDFTGEDLADGKGKNVTVVKNKSGKDLIKIITQYIKDDNTDNDYFALVIYGKAAQEAMK